MSEPMAWEYKVEHQSMKDPINPIDKMLNAYGKEGWELVSVVPVFPLERGDKFQVVFKRPLPPE